MAQGYGRSAGSDAAATEGEQGNVQPKRDLMLERIENNDFPTYFVVSITQGKPGEYCRKHPGNSNHLSGGI